MSSLLEAIKSKPVLEKLNELINGKFIPNRWESDFIESMRQRHIRFGAELRLSVAQKGVVERMWEQRIKNPALSDRLHYISRKGMFGKSEKEREEMEKEIAGIRRELDLDWMD